MSTNVFPYAYIVVSALLVSAGLFLTYWALDKRDRISRNLGMMMLCGVCTMIFYIVSAYMRDYFLFSLFNSLYFSSIDAMVIFLGNFTLLHTETELKGHLLKLSIVLAIWAAIDMIIMLVNPFFEIAISYVPQNTVLVPFSYDMHFLYKAHLTLCYVMIALIVIVFLHRTVLTPGIYKKQYLMPLGAILVIVLLNAVFLAIPALTLDISVWGYPLAAIFLYWYHYHYMQHSMVEHFKNIVFTKIDQGIALFDYKGRMILFNERLGKTFPEMNVRTGMPLSELREVASFPGDGTDVGDRSSLQVYTAAGKAVRCDISVLKSRHQENLGRLYVFTDIQRDTDVLTGFHEWGSFAAMMEEDPKRFSRPLAIAALDINSLTVINSTRGRSEGDLAIQRLAENMRQFFPRETYFVRGKEAMLLALIPKADEAEALRCSRNATHALDFQVQHAASVSLSDEDSVLSKIAEAEHGLMTRKLLNAHSGHSATINSLIRALEECDQDTEIHVQRTRESGAKLGMRLKLTDVQQSDLALLCLLHDIGKIGIPLDILNKPGKLSEDEWRVLRSHVEKGWQICNSSPELAGLADMVRHHHERWDGKGYPDGLSRESIPLLSRVISIVDSYDAMTHDRSYKKAMSEEEARAELLRCAGTQFDPTMVSEFLSLLEEEDEEKRKKAEELTDKETVPKEDGRPDAKNKSTAQETPEHRNDGSFVHDVHYARYLLDGDQHIVSVDDNFAALTGYEREEVFEKKLTQLDLIFPEEKTDYLLLVNEQIARNQVAYLEHRMRRKDGSALFVMCMGRMFYDSAVRAERAEIIITDITRTFALKQVADEEKDRAEKRLKRWESMYRLDSLTGLLNHEAYRNDVEEKILHRKHRLLFIMLDVDFFKQYNDTFGHHAGDQFLIRTAETLLGMLRKDDLACRMGGDEFSVCLFFDNQVEDEVIRRRARQIFETMSLKMASEKGGVSVSMGAVISGEKPETFDGIYEAADKALYCSKDHGKNRLTFRSDMQGSE